jgi:hypothetical protein
MWTLLLILACAKDTPPHLLVDSVRTKNFSGPASLETLVGSDPLVRRPNPRTQGDWDSLDEAPAIETWARTARQQDPFPADWATVETATLGTIGVPLARGARLAAIEVTQGDWDEPLQQSIAAWLGLSGVEARPATSTPAEPLAWLVGHDAQEKLQTARHLATRMVLEGWFNGPTINLEATAQALESDAHTLLAESPYGKLILSRAAELRDPDSAKTGQQFFWEATGHALQWAAADSDSEQAIIQKQRATFRAQRNSTPTAWNLARARELLRLNAASDASTGLALVTIAAERIEGSCPDKPCDGLYRVAALTRASRWHSDAAAGAAVWQVIALKRALDTLEVSLDKPSLYRRLPQIADALTGSQEATIELAFLRHRTATPGMMLTISRMAGGQPTSDAMQAIEAVGIRLRDACDVALKHGLPAAHEAVIKRIRLSVTAGR